MFINNFTNVFVRAHISLLSFVNKRLQLVIFPIFGEIPDSKKSPILVISNPISPIHFKPLKL